MRFRIIELKGVGPQNAKALKKAGLYYADQLRTIDLQKLSLQTKIDVQILQTWQDYVALMKIPTIGPAYAKLLHRSDVGVCSEADLSHCSAQELLEKMRQSNKKKHLVKVLPTIPKIQRWIATAALGTK